MIDKIIEDWYAEENKARKQTQTRRPAPQKPKDPEDEITERIAREFIKEIERIKAQREAPVWQQGPNRGGDPEEPVLPQWDGQISWMPDYPQIRRPAPMPLPLNPTDYQPELTPLPYYPQEGEPKITLYSNARAANPSPVPGPPPPDIPTPAPTYVPKPVQRQASNTATGYGMIDPALAQAQQQYGQRLGRGSADPALATAQQQYKDDWMGMAASNRQNEAAMFADPGLADAESIYDKMLHRGFADPALAEALQIFYSVKDNNYGINTEALVAKALSQVGNHEELLVDEAGKPILDENGKLQGTNKNIYGEWYGFDGVPWCAEFVNWCVNNIGISPDLIPNKRNHDDEGINNASTGAYLHWYDERNRYLENDKKTPPHAGDIVILNGAKHIGIVVAYDSTKKIVYTVEGNSGQYVSLNEYSLDDPYIVGYCLNGGNSFGKVPSASTIGIGKAII